MRSPKIDAALEQARDRLGESIAGELNTPLQGRTFSERFLWGLILANSSGSEKVDLQRLSDAHEIIFRQRPRQRADARNDRAALMTMAHWYRLDRDPAFPQKRKKPRSMLALAEDAKHLTTGNSEEAIVTHLRKTFARERSRLLSDADSKATEIEFLQRMIMDELQSILKYADLNIEVDE